MKYPGRTSCLTAAVQVFVAEREVSGIERASAGYVDIPWANRSLADQERPADRRGLSLASFPMAGARFFHSEMGLKVRRAGMVL